MSESSEISFSNPFEFAEASMSSLNRFESSSDKEQSVGQSKVLQELLSSLLLEVSEGKANSNSDRSFGNSHNMNEQYNTVLPSFGVTLLPAVHAASDLTDRGDTHVLQKYEVLESKSNTDKNNNNNNHHNGDKNYVTETHKNMSTESVHNVEFDHDDAQTPKVMVQHNPMVRRNVYVNGLPSYFRSNDLRELCKVYGQIEASKLCASHHGPTAKSYGFVLFFNEEDAQRCITQLDGSHLCGQRLQARYADSKATPLPCHPTPIPITGHSTQRNSPEHWLSTSTSTTSTSSSSTAAAATAASTLPRSSSPTPIIFTTDERTNTSNSCNSTVHTAADRRTHRHTCNNYCDTKHYEQEYDGEDDKFNQRDKHANTNNNNNNATTNDNYDYDDHNNNNNNNYQHKSIGGHLDYTRGTPASETKKGYRLANILRNSHNHRAYERDYNSLRSPVREGSHNITNSPPVSRRVEEYHRTVSNRTLSPSPPPPPPTQSSAQQRMSVPRDNETNLRFEMLRARRGSLNYSFHGSARNSPVPHIITQQSPESHSLHVRSPAQQSLHLPHVEPHTTWSYKAQPLPPSSSSNSSPSPLVGVAATVTTKATESDPNANMLSQSANNTNATAAAAAAANNSKLTSSPPNSSDLHEFITLHAQTPNHLQMVQERTNFRCKATNSSTTPISMIPEPKVEDNNNNNNNNKSNTLESLMLNAGQLCMSNVSNDNATTLNVDNNNNINNNNSITNTTTATTGNSVIGGAIPPSLLSQYVYVPINIALLASLQAQMTEAASPLSSLPSSLINPLASLVLPSCNASLSSASDAVYATSAATTATTTTPININNNNNITNCSNNNSENNNTSSIPAVNFTDQDAEECQNCTFTVVGNYNNGSNGDSHDDNSQTIDTNVKINALGNLTAEGNNMTNKTNAIDVTKSVNLPTPTTAGSSGSVPIISLTSSTLTSDMLSLPVPNQQHANIGTINTTTGVPIIMIDPATGMAFASLTR